MLFASFLRVCESCFVNLAVHFIKASSLILYQAAPRPDEVDCKVYETLAFQEWIWTRRKPAKRIIFI